jgi:hypothetical protein
MRPGWCEPGWGNGRRVHGLETGVTHTHTRQWPADGGASKVAYPPSRRHVRQHDREDHRACRRGRSSRGWRRSGRVSSCKRGHRRQRYSAYVPGCWCGWRRRRRWARGRRVCRAFQRCSRAAPVARSCIRCHRPRVLAQVRHGRGPGMGGGVGVGGRWPCVQPCLCADSAAIADPAAVHTGRPCNHAFVTPSRAWCTGKWAQLCALLPGLCAASSWACTRQRSGRRSASCWSRTCVRIWAGRGQGGGGGGAKGGGRPGAVR